MHTDLEQLFTRLDADRARLAATIPPKEEAQALADHLTNFLFPVHWQHYRPAKVQYAMLRDDLIQLLHPLLHRDNSAAAALADAFFLQLPKVHAALLEDAEAMLHFDPAATCLEEVIATYPGFYAISTYRIAHVLHCLGVPLLPRVFSEYVHGKTGIDIHPAATIGRSFFIDHGTGVVIGATAVIGNQVKIYQGVTLGALQVEKTLAHVKRHPTIGDNCIIYANSTILGGNTVIGHDSVIGGNTWVTESVPPKSIVLHQPQVKVRSK
ncbi:MAG: serine acetyltransferase [Saprospirales bacterium]|jgi:serine O-acetyltransferase|nr:serine acetyltransferase [Saprospirales bacterium]MBK8919945.1 serine acetyltransferase [Saprospirales bacterium]